MTALATRAACIGSAVLIIALTGCGDDDSETAVSEVSRPPATSTAPAEPAPIVAYREYWKVSNAADGEPNRDWTSQIQNVAADPLLTLFNDDIAKLRDRGGHYEGLTAIDPVLVSSEPRYAVISDCLDVTNKRAVQNGTTVERAPDQLLRYRAEAIVIQYENPDRWLVSQLNPKRTEPC